MDDHKEPPSPLTSGSPWCMIACFRLPRSIKMMHHALEVLRPQKREAHGLAWFGIQRGSRCPYPKGHGLRKPTTALSLIEEHQ